MTFLINSINGCVLLFLFLVHQRKDSLHLATNDENQVDTNLSIKKNLKNAWSEIGTTDEFIPFLFTVVSVFVKSSWKQTENKNQSIKQYLHYLEHGESYNLILLNFNFLESLVLVMVKWCMSKKEATDNARHNLTSIERRCKIRIIEYQNNIFYCF